MQVATVDELPYSFRRLYDFFAAPDNTPDTTRFASSFIDVRDVARMHVDGTTVQAAAGKRLIASASPMAVQDFCAHRRISFSAWTQVPIVDAYYSLPEDERPKVPFDVPRGEPGAGDRVRGQLSGFSADAFELLGWTPRGLPEVVRDSLQSMLDCGILESR